MKITSYFNLPWNLPVIIVLIFVKVIRRWLNSEGSYSLLKTISNYDKFLFGTKLRAIVNQFSNFTISQSIGILNPSDVELHFSILKKKSLMLLSPSPILSVSSVFHFLGLYCKNYFILKHENWLFDKQIYDKYTETGRF